MAPLAFSPAGSVRSERSPLETFPPTVGHVQQCLKRQLSSPLETFPPLGHSNRSEA